MIMTEMRPNKVRSIIVLLLYLTLMITRFLPRRYNYSYYDSSKKLHKPR